MSFQTACRIGDMAGVESFISKENICDWDRGLLNACLGGHIEIVNLMICYNIVCYIKNELGKFVIDD
jgi:hypothetical protein